MAKFVKIPVVVVLGHIDHGKSSLLEAIKKDFKITEKEAGGITQHIGAYTIDHKGKKITFIDTPGHEAFSEMRTRGAKVADIAILVVAADEGVKPQTKEAIKIIKESGAAMILVINKVDKEGVDLNRVKGELQKEEVLIEEWGGDIPVVPISAKTGEGIEDLAGTINVVAEVAELESDMKAKPKGVIIESSLDPKRGATATLLLEEGRIIAGDILATQTTFGKIKSIEDFKLNPLKEIFPGQIGIITGFEKAPEMGESFEVLGSIEEARQKVEIFRKEKKENYVLRKEVDKELNIILKADVKGSLEVIKKILEELVEDGVGIRILKSEVGEITDSDVRLAQGKEAKIIGFRTKPNATAQNLAQQRGNEILIFDIVYDLIDNIRRIMIKSREKKIERVDLGKLSIIAVFKTQKKGEKNYKQIAGGRVSESEDGIELATLEIKRGEEIFPGGKILEMQQEKKKINKARNAQDVAILYEGKTKIKEGDVLLVFKMMES